MGEQDQGHGGRRERKRAPGATARKVKFAAVLILVVFVAVVLAYNRDLAAFHFLGKDLTLPLCVWLFVAFGAGAAGAIAAHLLWRKRR